MGSSAVLKSSNHLSQQEINEIIIKNEYIVSLKANSKEEDKLISIKDLNSLTNGIIKEKILRKILQVCGSVKDKLTQDDFAYFYSLLVTPSFEAKINFLLDFIFIKKNKLPKEKYIKKVNIYFENSQKLTDIFLDKNLIENENTLSREKVYTYITNNHKESLMNYPLLQKGEIKALKKSKTEKNKSRKSISSNKNRRNSKNSKKDDIEDNDDNSEDNSDLKNNSKEINTDASINSKGLNLNKNKKYDELFPEFKKIERENNGIFPITLFEAMLRDIDIKEIYIDLIGDYLRKKAQKSFLNFELFKEILSLFISDHNSESKTNKQINTSLFNLIAYPKNSIKKSILINLLTKEKFLSQKDDDLNVDKNIHLKEFLKLCEEKDYSFYKSFKNIQYLKYIFFDEDVGNNHQLEYNIINILIKQKSLTDYIIERLQTDTDFYLIDIEFWKQWEKLTRDYDKERNYNDLRKLRIRTDNFCDSNGQIMEGKEYGKDYIVISETMHNLFVKWYGQEKDKEIKRSKIYLEKGCLPYKGEKDKKFKFFGYDKKIDKDYELELNPKFVALYSYSDFYQILKKPAKQKEKEIRNLYKTCKMVHYSRKAKFSDTYHSNSIIRYWVCVNGEAEKVSDDDIFDDLKLPNKFIILIEEKVNNKWQSDLLKKDIDKSSVSKEVDNENNEEDLYKVGFYNIGNTCYMNSVMQIFLNIKELKDIFIPKNSEENKNFLSFILNTNNNEINKIVSEHGYLVLELMNLLKSKWKGKHKTLNPRKFKEICGEYNDIFKTSEQQDAHDFYTFVIDKLHEETNINYDSDNQYKDITNNEAIDTTELDLANECWANNIRKNASYFYALFMGQLKSTLICSECNTKKIKFEPFSALELPIPEGKNIIIEIILFRLPYTLRKEFVLKKNDSNLNEGIVISKKITKNIRKSTSKTNNVSLSEISFDKNEKTDTINSYLNLNIPLKLKMEIGRKEKCSTIIDKLKCIDDLNIEKHYNYTEFIMFSQGKYISEDYIADSTFTNFNVVNVYEIINFEGIKNIFDYEEYKNLKAMKLNEQKIENNNKEKSIKEKGKKKILTNCEKKNLTIPSLNFSIDTNILQKNNLNTYEILVPIVHRYPFDESKNFISYSKFEYFWNHNDFIILSLQNSIKPYDLYEIMWKKYMYFLDSPSYYISKRWWKVEEKIDSKRIPFQLTLINKDTLSCALCPWFRLCQGCTINPSENKFINIKTNDIIAVEWDKDVYKTEINKNNLNLVMKHSSANLVEENAKQKEDEISLNDCLKLFTKEEEISDIECEKCKKKTLFKKTLEIERLPQYLVIVLKRFKYILTTSVKIQNLIKFPLDDLPLQNYVSQKNINYKYNLFGLINHSGSLEWGHYNSIFKVNDIWALFDDSYVSEINNGIESKKVYMLIYKSNDIDKNLKNVYFLGLMDRAYRVYISQIKFKHLFNYEFDGNNNVKKQYKSDCQFYYGEPVTINGKRGFITDIENIDKGNSKEEDRNVKVKIKLKKGFYTAETKCSKIIKEIYKKPNKFDIEEFLNKISQNSNNKKDENEEKEVVCGSRVCNIF